MPEFFNVLPPDEARELLFEHLTAVLSPETIPATDALNRVTASPVFAPHALPAFRRSTMDGYAVKAANTYGASESLPAFLNVNGEVPMGQSAAVTLYTGEAVIVHTGGMIPETADAVVQIEHTQIVGAGVVDAPPYEIEVFKAVAVGQNVLQVGEDVQHQAEILPAGHLLRPQDLGGLLALGIMEVSVTRRPRVGILATGDELIAIDEPLRPGKIRNSNGYTQLAQVMALGAEPVSLGVAKDVASDVRRCLQQGLDAGVDLFISSAGVSVGAYDVVKAVLEAEGNVGFWRVRMRPGKPLAFGTYHGVPYLGLPGNPVSAMVSFERFARAAILKMAGHQRLDKPQIPVTIQESMTSDGRESYIRAVVQRDGKGYTAVTTGGQGSHMMTSLVKANALLIVPEGIIDVPAGSQLQAWMLDWPETVF